MIVTTLKQQFLVTALAIALFLLVLGFFTQFAIRRIMQNHQLSYFIESLALIEAELDNTHKSFLLLESVNPDFFAGVESQHVIRMDSLFEIGASHFTSIRGHRIFHRIGLHDQINTLENHMDSIRLIFSSLVQSLKEYGYESFGLSGQMRRHIHVVEQALSMKNQHELSAMMLTLRRHEKDFMLRKDRRYIERFDHTLETFIIRMRQVGIDESLIAGVRNYQRSFHELAEMELYMGTSAGEGLLGDLTRQFGQTRPVITQIRQKLEVHSSQQVALYMLVLLVAFILIPVGVILVYSRLSRRITQRLLFLRDYLMRMGKGELPQRIEYPHPDEIGQMIQSVNNLNDNLKNTREFALEVGKGNFQTQINVFDNQGDLGGSLIQMKSQLEKVALEQREQKLKEEQRTWHAEGLALFAHIVRSYSDRIDDMAFAVIRSLVNYLEICQGGLFSIEENDPQDRFFRLAACYAYDRKKFLERKVEWGEGLLGAAALEQETVYITDLPSDYMQITSGLGGTRPACLLVVPLICDDGVMGVLELASIDDIPQYKRDFVEKISESIASHIAQLRNRIKTTQLLQRSEQLAEHLKQQEEELRQNMEEMMANQEEADRTIELLRRELNAKEHQINVIQMRDFLHADPVSPQ
ncbi:MAG: GAF domain-containing protein [Bacteroidales bacterium]